MIRRLFGVGAFMLVSVFAWSSDEVGRFGPPIRVLPTLSTSTAQMPQVDLRRESDHVPIPFLSASQDSTEAELIPVDLGPKCTLLSLDGGGIRGYIEALILHDMEVKFKQRLAQRGLGDAKLIEAFDLVVGTSAGAIAAGCLTVPSSDNPKKPRHDVAALLEFFEGTQRDASGEPTFEGSKASSMFTRTWTQCFFSLFGLLDEKYSTQPLSKALKSYGLKDAFLTQACVPTAMVTSEITDEGFGCQPVYLRSYDKEGSLSGMSMRAATLCSGAAPTYFERVCVLDNDDEFRYFVDGGLSGSNHPGPVAEAEAIKFLPHLLDGDKTNMFLVSVGTGVAKVMLDGERAANWGLASWVRPVIDLSLALPTLTNDMNLRTRFGDYTPGQSAGYIRLTPWLEKPSPLDDARPVAMQMLRRTALQYIADNQETIHATVDQLVLRYIAKQAADAPGKKEVRRAFKAVRQQGHQSQLFAG
ncbi:MAG: patatin-like phospholipase family protein [Proteobacteria bacterium]|nr:patatin-like phospholipase family protein [Pseudomonadota bacterium]